MVRPDLSDAVARAWSAVLMAKVGRGCEFTVEFLAEITGVPARKIEAIRAREQCPRWAEGIALLRALGTSSADMVLAPAGLGGTRQVEAAEADGHTMMAQMADRMAQLSNALRDRRLDHREKLALKPELRDLAHELLGFVAGLDEGCP